jgi:hypothetical protein
VIIPPDMGGQLAIYQVDLKRYFIRHFGHRPLAYLDLDRRSL